MNCSRKAEGDSSGPCFTSSTLGKSVVHHEIPFYLPTEPGDDLQMLLTFCSIKIPSRSSCGKPTVDDSQSMLHLCLRGHSFWLPALSSISFFPSWRTLSWVVGFYLRLGWWVIKVSKRLNSSLELSEKVCVKSSRCIILWKRNPILHGLITFFIYGSLGSKQIVHTYVQWSGLFALCSWDTFLFWISLFTFPPCSNQRKRR